MADVRPFRGLRYDQARVGDLAAVVAPPYDVVTPAQQEAYYRASPYNVIRLELAQATPEEGQARYRAAASCLDGWLRDGVLVRDRAPAMYVYEIHFVHRAQPHRLRGFIARLRLEEWERRIVRPHERTMAAPKEDRRRLLRACRTNLSPIYCLYADPAGRAAAALDGVVNRKPDIQLTGADGLGHQLWVVPEPDLAAELAAALHLRPVYIADGHHRYETALFYRDEQRRARGANAEEAPHDFVMALLVRLEEPGLLILATHRLVSGLDDRALERLERVLEGSFIQEERSLAAGVEPLLEELARRGRRGPVFGLLGPGPARLRLLELREDRRPMTGEGEGRGARGEEGAERGSGSIRPPGQGAELPERSGVSWSLDVNLLHGLVLEPVLEGSGLPGAAASGGLRADRRPAYGGGHLGFERDAEEAIAAVRGGRAQVAFFLNPPTVDQIRAVADAGEAMPEKSTFFYPKPLTGLVMNPLV